MKRRQDFEENNELKRVSIRTYSDAADISDILNWPKEERLNYIKNSQNPYGWPVEYLDIYSRESKIRNPVGFNSTLKINDMKIYEHRGEQAGKIQIQQVLNTNCIKGMFRGSDSYGVDNLLLTKSFKETLLRFNNIIYYNNFSEYYSDFIKVNRYINDDTDEYNNLVVQYNELSKKFPNKYRLILIYLREVFTNLSEYICVAGGFALSMYIYENYGYHIGFSDIDLFIHSCGETIAANIITRLSQVTKMALFENDNVVVSFFAPSMEYGKFSKLNNPDYSIVASGKMSIQIIKRLYTSPAQVILGFDVDSCCILTTLQGDIYTTERGFYSIKNGYNVLNFDRMSPSYEYRLSKYNNRGFGIWIPFINYFKENLILASQVIDKTKLSSIIIRKLLNTNIRGRNIEILSDYDSSVHRANKITSGNEVKLKYLNPDEQIINTFHRIVVEDPIEWYPVKHPLTIQGFLNINNYDNEQLFEITEPIFGGILSMNLISNIRISNNKSYIFDYSSKLVKYLYTKYPSIVMTGNLISAAVGGGSCNTLKIYINDSNLNKQIEDEIFCFRASYKVINKIKNSVLCTKYGFYNFPYNIINVIKGDPIKVNPNNKNHHERHNRHNRYKSININKAISRQGESYLSNEFDEYINTLATSPEIIPILTDYVNSNDFIHSSVGNVDPRFEIITDLKNNVNFLYKYGINIESYKPSKPYTNIDLETFCSIFKAQLSRRYNKICIEDLESRNIDVIKSNIINMLNLSNGVSLKYDLYPLIVNEIDNNFMETVLFSDGKFLTTEYGYNLLKIGCTTENISSGEVKILDDYACYEFIPKP